MPHEPQRAVPQLPAPKEEESALIIPGAYRGTFSLSQGTGTAYTTQEHWEGFNNRWTITCNGQNCGTASNVTWSEWNNSITVTGSSSTTATWQFWVDADGRHHRGAQPSSYGQIIPPRRETAEEKRAREEYHAKQILEQQRIDRERRMSRLRAKKLLVDHLNPQQREDYEKKGFFFLYTNKGRKYRIDQGTHGNVKLIDVTTDTPLGAYCSQPGGVPDEDAMLAQKFWLEMDEDAFIEKANFTRMNLTGDRVLLDAHGRPIEQRRAA